MGGMYAFDSGIRYSVTTEEKSKMKSAQRVKNSDFYSSIAMREGTCILNAF